MLWLGGVFKGVPFAKVAFCAERSQVIQVRFATLREGNNVIDMEFASRIGRRTAPACYTAEAIAA